MFRCEEYDQLCQHPVSEQSQWKVEFFLAFEPIVNKKTMYSFWIELILLIIMCYFRIKSALQNCTPGLKSLSF